MIFTKKSLIGVLVLLAFGAGLFFMLWDNEGEAGAFAADEIREDWDPENYEGIIQHAPATEDWHIEAENGLVDIEITEEELFIIDNSGEKYAPQFTLNTEENVITITAPEDGYTPGGQYELFISESVFEEREEDIHLGLVIEREEKEEVVFRKDLVEIDEDEVISFDEEEELVLENNRRNRRLQEETILLVPVEDEIFDHAAVKITEIHTDQNIVVKVEEPDFIELFEKLDINYTYSFADEEAIFIPYADEVEFDSFAYLNSGSLMADAGQSGGIKAEVLARVNKNNVQFPSMSMENTAHGFEFNVKNMAMFEAGGQTAMIDGAFTFYDSEVELDIDLSFRGVNRFNFEMSQRTVNEFTMRMTDSNGNKEISDGAIPDPTWKNARAIGEINIPVASTGLFIRFAAFLYFNADVDGKPQLTIEFDRVDRFGVVKTSSGYELYSDGDSGLTGSLRGEASVGANGGIGGSFGLEAYRVAGMAANKNFGVYGDGSAAAWAAAEISSSENDGASGDYCFDLEAGRENKVFFDLTLARNTRLEHTLFTYDVMLNQVPLFSSSSCNIVSGIDLGLDRLELEPGDGKIQLSGNLLKESLTGGEPDGGDDIVFDSDEYFEVRDSGLISISEEGYIEAVNADSSWETVLYLTYEGENNTFTKEIPVSMVVEEDIALSDQEVINLIVTAEEAALEEFQKHTINEVAPVEYGSSVEEILPPLAAYFTTNYQQGLLTAYYEDPESYNAVSYYFPMVYGNGTGSVTDINHGDEVIEVYIEPIIWEQREKFKYTINYTNGGWKLDDLTMQSALGGESSSASDDDSSTTGGESPGSGDWSGRYVIDNPELRGELHIYNETETSFQFDTEIAYTHVASYDGAQMYKDGNIAYSESDETGCWFILEKNGDALQLAGHGCLEYHGAGIDFNHGFVRE